SSSQSGGDAQVDHSKSTHEVDGGKKKKTTTTTSTHAINKSFINLYARPVGIKCYRCQERVNLAEGDKVHSESEDEGLIISPNAIFKDDDDHSEAFLGRQRQRKQPIHTWRKMKRVIFTRFLLVDYEQMLYSLYQNCRQSSQTVTEYAKEFTRLASCNQLSESNVQQVTRFNNGLQYDIQVIISLQTTRTIDEAIRIALKAEQTLKKQGIGSSMYKIKMDTNQSSSSQSGGDAQVDHSKSTHEVDGGKKKTTTTTTSTHAVNKSFINLYARPVG
nr:putative nucleotidyltransferase, ribonuclease H [Tanacetum cinerariifolium]